MFKDYLKVHFQKKYSSLFFFLSVRVCACMCVSETFFSSHFLNIFFLETSLCVPPQFKETFLKSIFFSNVQKDTVSTI